MQHLSLLFSKSGNWSLDMLHKGHVPKKLILAWLQIQFPLNFAFLGWISTRFWFTTAQLSSCFCWKHFSHWRALCHLVLLSFCCGGVMPWSLTHPVPVDICPHSGAGTLHCRDSSSHAITTQHSGYLQEPPCPQGCSTKTWYFYICPVDGKKFSFSPKNVFVHMSGASSLSMHSLGLKLVLVLRIERRCKAGGDEEPVFCYHLDMFMVSYWKSLIFFKCTLILWVALQH